MKHSLMETNSEPGKKESLLTRCANIFSRWSQKYVPDAFVIAVLLTLFTFIIALLMNPSNPYKIVKSWGWVLDLFNVYNANGIANGYRDDASFCPVY